MHEVVVLGGYGQLGRFCVRELIERTDARVVVAGPSVQRAEALARGFGARASGAYCNARDPRTTLRLLEGAHALVVACGGDPRPILDTALSVRVPTVSMSALWLDPRSASVLGDEAWKAQVPIVLQAGALPGLPGVLAEQLVRGFGELDELRLASTGPWAHTETAARDLRIYRSERPRARAAAAVGAALWRPDHWLPAHWWPSEWLPGRWNFPEPVGPRSVRAATSADLDGFAAHHLVGRVRYFEPAPYGLPSWAQLAGRATRTGAGFALAGAALACGEGLPVATLELVAPHPLLPAAGVAGSLVQAALAGQLPAGVSTPREALSPARVLRDLEKRGVAVAQRRSEF